MTDPATHAAQCLAATIRAYRDLLTDAGYAAVLPAFESLSHALPGPDAVPAPRQQTQSDAHSMERGIA